MAIYADLALRAGFEGFLALGIQDAPLVACDAVTDPTEPVSTDATFVGWMQMPGWAQNDNVSTDTGAGSMRDAYAILGRRENTINTRIMVSDGSLFATTDDTTGMFTAVRKHGLTGTSEGGLTKGLQLLSAFWGAGSDYGSGFGYVGLDTLIQSLGFTFQEGAQPVVADL